jgi:hypothetical protein
VRFGDFNLFIVFFYGVVCIFEFLEVGFASSGEALVASPLTKTNNKVSISWSGDKVGSKSYILIRYA